MLLQDRIAAANEPLRIARGDGLIYDLPNSNLIRAELQSASRRYVLNDDVAALVAHAGFGAPERLARCFDLLRVPAPLVWLEWNEKGRRQALAELGIVDLASAARGVGRSGLLIRSDEAGRRGQIFCVWATDGAPDLSPFVIHFDLDDATFHSRSEARGLTRALAFHDSEELSWLLAHAHFELHDPWRRYYMAACRSKAEFDSALDENLSYIGATVPFMAAFCLLLIARDSVDMRPSDLQRLNLARKKRGRTPLLDYTELFPYAPREDAAIEAALRAKARLHYVTGHFVRRHTTVYWRRSHLRGKAAQSAPPPRIVDPA